MKKPDDNETKLHLALMQTNNIISLIKGNEWEKYMYSHLHSVKVELERQIFKCQHEVDNTSDSV